MTEEGKGWNAGWRQVASPFLQARAPDQGSPPVHAAISPPPGIRSRLVLHPIPRRTFGFFHHASQSGV